MLKKRPYIYIALLHYPIVNKKGDIITTSITNYDIHDIARISRTYGIEKYFMINPMESQIMLAERILSYWSDPKRTEFLPDRQDALSIVEVVSTLDEAINIITEKNGSKPVIIATDAKESDNRITYDAFRQEIWSTEQTYLIIFGTGFGLHSTILQKADYILEPIRGLENFNHLPVRAAVAIILDRLLGERNPNQIKENNIEKLKIKKQEVYYASSN